VDDAKLAELKKEHGSDLYTAKARGIEFVFKIDPGAWERCEEYSNDKDRRAAAMRTLFFDTVVWPIGPELDAIVRKLPALPNSVGNFIAQAHGVTNEVEVKKL
jgi:hypothetical protein